MKIFSFRIIWICTNNDVEYEALHLGLSKENSIGIKCLVFHGDSKLVIKQVKNQISAKHHYLKTYRNRVWYLLESFLAINFTSITRRYNQIANALVEKVANY